jgi:hypothetical protein
VLDLDVIEAREKAATPGPWEIVKGMDQRYDVCRDCADETDITDGGYGKGSIPVFEDAVFMAQASEDVPAMAREIRRLRAALARVLELHDEAHDTPDADGAPALPPDVVCRMRWVALSELEGGPETPWWDMPYAAGSEAAAERRGLA